MANPMQGMRAGCQLKCVNGEQRMQCPALPAIDKVVGKCAGVGSITFGASETRPDYQAMQTKGLANIATVQAKMNNALAAARYRMDPKNNPPAYD